MVSLIIVLHIIVCVLLILVVLLQAGKGASMGATFGAGSSQSVFGSSGAAPFLTKLTTAVAIIFMITSIGLTIFSSKAAKQSVVQGISTLPEPVPPSAGTPTDVKSKNKPSQPIEPKK